ncbi:MerR family transcriptional regulator [Cryobacterium algoricola]|uniref:MerR family transcriptional regulator n=2 Tax=Cryobacterium algoricola TaxID=1259183 RepID=A0ABY2IHR1_9MICO|nr:MerR family transcriptional regulator [Cryobacterium algoricola]
MRIGELSSLTGVSRRSLRYYEEQGLITSTRSEKGQRHYDGQQANRVDIIQTFFAAGLSSRVIVDMVPCMVNAPTVEVAHRSTEIMIAEGVRLDEAMARLEKARSVLDNLIRTSQEYLSRSTP